MAGRPRWCRRMLLLVVAGTLASLPAMAGGRERPAAERPPLLVEVKRGDTVWTIARSYGNPAADVREHVWRIQKANQFDLGQIEPSTVVVIPPECLPRT
jgi:nucleoid-associated protein YgaU